jgi:acyl-CoA thioesterase FadM
MKTKLTIQHKLNFNIKYNDIFSKQLSFRWSDLDPNFHVRHSAYYDFGAQHRIEI